MKKIIALITACLALTACNSSVQENPDQYAIQAVYSLNSNITTKSKSVAEVVAKLQAVRLVACPADFVDAYKAYIKAWEKMVAVEKTMYGANMQKANTDIAKFISNYKSNPTQSVVNLKTEWPSEGAAIDSATDAISKAFTALTNVGIKYNAVYPQSSGGIF